MSCEGGSRPPGPVVVAAVVFVTFVIPAFGADLCVPDDPVARAACGGRPAPRNDDSLDEFVLPSPADDESLEDTAIESLIAPSAGGTERPGEAGGKGESEPPTPETQPR